MKQTNTIVLAGALLWLVGCASPTKVAVLEPIGPAPPARPQNRSDGYLQVYSARKKADIDANMEEWRWDNDFGKNEFQYAPAHTDYTIYGGSGEFLRRVRNAGNPDDPNPTLVSLAPGSYEIRAEAEAPAGMVEVRVPVVIRAGRTTAAHLVGGWIPHFHYTGSEVVRLPGGEIAGWLVVR